MSVSIDQVIGFARSNPLAYASLLNPTTLSPRHIKLFAKMLCRVESGQCKRLIINVPPRHGKSQIVSRFFPAWYLGKNPSKSIIFATYSQDLSNEFGRSVRDNLESDEHKAIFPRCFLQGGSRAMDRVATVEGGVYVAVGVGGSITGRGADCLPAGTMVSTTAGSIAIEKLNGCASSVKALSYNYQNGRIEEKAIQGWVERKTDGLYRITTSSGRVVEATGNHRIFTGQKYTAAEHIAAGDSILLLVPKRISKALISNKKINKKRLFGLVLQSFLLSIASRSKKLSKLLEMFKQGFKQWRQVLQRLQAKISWEKSSVHFSHETVPYLQHTVQGCLEGWWKICRLLFQDMFPAWTFSTDVWCGKSKMAAWSDSFKEPTTFSKSFQSNEKEDFRKRQQSLRCMSGESGTIGSASHRLQPNEQCGVQSGDAMLFLSSEVSCSDGFQTVKDTVALVERICVETNVYDIQVEDNHNFFANGILVHNCLLIDDPIKGRAEADSEAYQQSLRHWYSAVARTRLHPDGAIVVVQTRWHKDDLCGYLLSEHSHENWQVVNLPAIGPDDEPLWPERYSYEALMETKKSVGLYEWQCLYQQDPILPDGMLVKPHWLDVDIQSPILQKYISVDPAISSKTSADETAVCVVGVTQNGCAKEIETHHGRWDIGQQLQVIQALHKKHNAIAIGVESVAYQKVLGQLLTNLSLPVREVPADADKVSRLYSVMDLFTSGRVAISTVDLRHQLLVFRGKSEKNDMVDAFVHGLRMIRHDLDILYEQSRVTSSPPPEKIDSENIWFKRTMEQYYKNNYQNENYSVQFGKETVNSEKYF